MMRSAARLLAALAWVVASGCSIYPAGDSYRISTAPPTPSARAAAPPPAELLPPDVLPADLARAAAPACINERQAVARGLAAVLRVETDYGTGSGILISDKGMVLTAAHLVQNRKVIRATWNEKSTFSANLVWFDGAADVAVLRLLSPVFPPMQPLEWSPDEPLVGSRVLTVGFARGLAGSASITAGIISRRVERDRVKHLQTDAAINPGDSGGALLDLCGRLVGVIAARLDGYEGIGLAVSIKDDIMKKIWKDDGVFGAIISD